MNNDEIIYNLDKYFTDWKKNEITFSNGKVSSTGNMVLKIEHKHTKIPIEFERVDGDFDCGYNTLETLENSPNYVGGSFYCFNNKLETLKGCPQHIGGDFNCFINPLQSLLYRPDYIGGVIRLPYKRDMKLCDLLDIKGWKSVEFCDSRYNQVHEKLTHIFGLFQGRGMEMAHILAMKLLKSGYGSHIGWEVE